MKKLKMKASKGLTFEEGCLRVIKAGKVQKLNVLQQEITTARLRTIKPATMVVLIFDTDTNNLEILKENIKILESCTSVSEIVTIPQCQNLEEELICSCNITQLLNSKSRTEFKTDLMRVSNLDKKLNEHQFDIAVFLEPKTTTTI